MTTLDLLQEVTFGRINMCSGAFGYGYRCMDHSSYSNQWKTRQVYFFFTLQYRQLTPTPDFFYAAEQAKSSTISGPAPRNIIMMISDGMGPASVSFSRTFYQYIHGLPYDHEMPLDTVCESVHSGTCVSTKTQLVDM